LVSTRLQPFKPLNKCWVGEQAVALSSRAAAEAVKRTWTTRKQILTTTSQLIVTFCTTVKVDRVVKCLLCWTLGILSIMMNCICILLDLAYAIIKTTVYTSANQQKNCQRPSGHLKAKDREKRVIFNYISHTIDPICNHASYYHVPWCTRVAT
jgi:hypothetical protein